MRKQDLIDAIAAQQNLPKRQVTMVVDATFNAIRDAMANGDKVTLTGFGSFEVVQRNEREGRNPRTGQTITIAARRSPAVPRWLRAEACGRRRRQRRLIAHRRGEQGGGALLRGAPPPFCAIAGGRGVG